MCSSDLYEQAKNEINELIDKGKYTDAMSKIRSLKYEVDDESMINELTDKLEKTVAQDMVSIPGCMTPTEIVAADKAGADFIKLFPAGTLGMKYCRNIYAPLNHVRYLATGGVNEESFREYLEMGFAGAGISSKLVDKTLRAEGRWDELEERARRFVAIAREYNR